MQPRRSVYGKAAQSTCETFVRATQRRPIGMDQRREEPRVAGFRIRTGPSFSSVGEDRRSAP